MCNPWCPMKPGCQSSLERILKPYGLDCAYLDRYQSEEDKKKREAFREDLRAFCPLDELFKMKVDELISKHELDKSVIWPREPVSTRYDMAKEAP